MSTDPNSGAPAGSPDPTPAAEPQAGPQTGPQTGPLADAATQAEPAAATAFRHHDDLIGDLRRELSDLRDKNLRLLADMENLRRRTEDEKSNAAKYAITRFATDVITVGDNFQRAMGAVPPGAADADPALMSLVEGVQMIEREYLNVLDRHGVKRVAAIGEIFSPHLHQPMLQEPKPDVPAGTILRVFQEGYTIGDRLLRAAVVTVAEGGPKPGAKSAEAAAEVADAPVMEPAGTPAEHKTDEPKGTA